MRRLMKRPCQHMGFPMSPFLATSRRQQQWVFEETFLRLDGRAPEVLAPVMDYVYRTWIRASIFKIHHWSVFMTSIRTNNDVGGWHNRLNTSVVTRGSVPFYHLLLVLHREATNITVQMKMVSEGKMQRFQRKRTLQVEGRVFKLWNNYCERSITASELLTGCASI
uniref:Uncharacterized protein n=1 Tax=Magallana gigas TaxID=29159 RepID=A0A8W8NGT1_MAGGI|nr:uncharacterized protein LOC117685079 [Crassostrea gigas]